VVVVVELVDVVVVVEDVDAVGEVVEVVDVACSCSSSTCRSNSATRPADRLDQQIASYSRPGRVSPLVLELG
jgi:hypothetical protein